MKARPLYNERIQYSDAAVAHVVVWQISQPMVGSTHSYKYRLAYVVSDECVLRYDNEAGKGDHKHVGVVESGYTFIGLPELLADFSSEIERWNHENDHL